MSSQVTAVVIDTDDSSRSSLITQLRTMPGVKVEADAGDLQLGMKLARQVRPVLLVLEAKPLDEALAAAERFHLESQARDVCTWSRQAGDKPTSDGIGMQPCHDDRDRLGGTMGHLGRGCRARHDHVDREPSQLGRERG